MKYKVKVTEELSTDVDIDAGSREEVKKKAYDMWQMVKSYLETEISKEFMFLLSSRLMLLKQRLEEE